MRGTSSLKCTDFVFITVTRNVIFYSESLPMEPNHFSPTILESDFVAGTSFPWSSAWVSHTLTCFEIKSPLMKGGLEAGRKDGRTWYFFNHGNSQNFFLRQRPGCTITGTLGLSHGFFKYLVFVLNYYSHFSSASITQKMVHRGKGIAICWLLTHWTVSIISWGPLFGEYQSHRMVWDEGSLQRSKSSATGRDTFH